MAPTAPCLSRSISPAFDGSYRPLAEPLDLARLHPRSPDVSVLIEDDPAAADAAVSRAITDLGLPTWACDPDGIFATVHEDANGRARVVFVINPGEGDAVAHVISVVRRRARSTCSTTPSSTSRAAPSRSG